GWDCHGLPIELKVEEKIGKPGVNKTAKEFREYCRVYAKEQVENQKADFIRLGVQGLWDKPYLTMDYHTEANTVRNIKNIIKHNHLSKGYKPVHWCMDCASSLAEAEVEYYDKKSPSVYVKFEASDINAINSVFNTQEKNKVDAIIWTTTPWTLPSNQAIALNPELDYSLVKYNKDEKDNIVIIASELLENVFEKYKVETFEILGQAKGHALEGFKFKHPFYEYEVPVVLGDHVSLDAGTGIVHTAPDHGMDDYIVGLKYKLPMVNLVNASGIFKEDVKFFGGQYVFKANKSVIEKLIEKDALALQEDITHSYPHCWRHKTPIIFRATSQWFISMEQNNLRNDALNEIKKVSWIPSWGEARISTMVQNRPDWCISRQRTWGTPLTLIINKETQEIHPDMENLIEAIALRIEKEGIQAWWDINLEELLGSEAHLYEKSKDTLDVWFDSGSTYKSVVQDREEFDGAPIDMYLEGSDQHRGFFMSSLMLSVATDKKSPYKQVLTHGFAVDKHGKKMSKSIGNVITPQEIINQYGADILRLWVASSDYTNEITVDKDLFKQMADNYRRIRNTIRFLLSNLNGFDSKKDLLPRDNLIKLDRWAINAAYEAQEEIIEAYNNNQFHMVVQKILSFCSITMGSFYLDIIKDRQYTTGTNSTARRSCQTAIWHITEALTRWIAPILSFTADELWENIPNRDSEFVFTSLFYNGLYKDDDSQMDSNYWGQILDLKNLVNKKLEELRNEKIIKSNLEAKVTLYIDTKWNKVLEKIKDELRFIFITSAVELKPISTASNLDQSLELCIEAEKYEAPKCPRCWHHVKEIGLNKEYPELCPRCIENIYGNGESRKFA
ncbi:MAG: isoleucine--tRNA ligase, partial [Psittacicella sp.]